MAERLAVVALIGELGEIEDQRAVRHEEPDGQLHGVGDTEQIVAIEEVSTERINISGRTATFTQRVQVLSDSQLVRVVEPLTAQVTVPILAPVGPARPPETETAATGTTTPTTTETTGTP